MVHCIQYCTTLHTTYYTKVVHTMVHTHTTYMKLPEQKPDIGHFFGNLKSGLWVRTGSLVIPLNSALREIPRFQDFDGALF